MIALKIKKFNFVRSTVTDNRCLLAKMIDSSCQTESIDLVTTQAG